MTIPQLTETDKFIYQKRIQPYPPQQIFDAHSHINIKKFNPDLRSLAIAGDCSLENVDVPDLKRWRQTLFPDSQISGLIFGFLTCNCNRSAVNSYLADNIVSSDKFSIFTYLQMSEQDLHADKED